MRALHIRTGNAVVAGVLVLALGLVGGGTWALTRASASENLVLGAVTTGSISQTLAGSGTVETLTAQSVSFPVSAEVTSVSARVGDKVKAGQELATIDPTELENGLAEKELAVAQANEDLETAENGGSSSGGSVSSGGASGGGGGQAGGASTGGGATTGGAGSQSTKPTPSPSASPSQPPAAEVDIESIKQRLADARKSRDQAQQELVAAITLAVSKCSVTEAEPPETEPTTEPTAIPSAAPTATSSPSGSAVPTATPTASLTGDPEPTPTPTPTDGPEMLAESGEAVELGAKLADMPVLVATPMSAGPIEPTPTESESEKPEPEPSQEPESPSDNAACIAALEALKPADAALASAVEKLDEIVDELVVLAEQSQSPGPDEGGSSGGASSGGSGSGAGTRPSGTASTSSNSGTSGGAGSSAGKSGSGGGGSPGGAGSSASGGQKGTEATTVEQAEVALQQAQLELTNAQLALDGATLLAPVDGVLTAMPFEVGEVADTSDVATVTAGEGVVLPMEVGESDIGDVAVGQSATLTSATGVESEGKVATIAMLPSSSGGGSATYTVTVAVTDPQEGLVVGTTANAVITVASADDVALVPISAVSLTGGDAGTVRVLRDGDEASERVTIGIRGTTHFEVTEGLSAGDQVVLSDLSQELPTSSSSIGRGMGAMGGGGPSGGFGGGGTGGGFGGGGPGR